MMASKDSASRIDCFHSCSGCGRRQHAEDITEYYWLSAVAAGVVTQNYFGMLKAHDRPVSVSSGLTSKLSANVSFNHVGFK